MKPETKAKTKPSGGWVKVRRGLLDHLKDGVITPNEYTVFNILLGDADSSTGGGEINAPLLLAVWLHSWSPDAAQRALAGLERKRYIWRRDPVGKKRAAPYFINKYELTDGANKGATLDLSQVFETNNSHDIKLVKGATQGATVPATMGATMGAIVTANSYKNGRTQDRENIEQRTPPPVNSPMCDSLCDSNSDFAKENVSRGNPQCVTGDVTHSVTPLRDPNSNPINGAAGLAEILEGKPKTKPAELTREQEDALAMQELAKEIERRNKGATA